MRIQWPKYRVSCRNVVEVDSLHDQKNENENVIFNPEALVEALGSVIMPGQ